MAYWKAGKCERGSALLEQVRDSLLKKFGPDDTQTVDALDDLSAVYATVGKAEDAIILAQAGAGRTRQEIWYRPLSLHHFAE